MNESSQLRAAASAVAPAGVGDAGTVIARDEGAAMEALSAYFGAADDRRAVRIVVGGDDLGYLERERALALLDVQTRDLGHSSGWTLPGVSDYEAIELRCAVEGCTANPIFADAFDERYPPDCPLHPGHPLARAGA
jgi:hypothetical protein